MPGCLRDFCGVRAAGSDDCQVPGMWDVTGPTYFFPLVFCQFFFSPILSIYSSLLATTVYTVVYWRQQYVQ